MDDLSKLVPGQFYHIYNRGNNKEDIFPAPENYFYFLRQWQRYIDPVAETFAYVLLKNHFHFLICIRSLPELLLLENIDNKSNDPLHLSNKLSKCFSNCFNAYAKAINKRFGRSGSLFQERFRRKLILDEEYLTGVILYIHTNALKHGFVQKDESYTYSSYQTILSDKPTRLQRRKVIGLFGGLQAVVEAHNRYSENIALKKMILEARMMMSEIRTLIANRTGF